MMTYVELARLLAKQADQIGQLPVVTGFDGFVDEMISVVDQRQTLDAYKRIETITHFGEKISAAAGQSSLREIVINEVDPGGCAINMGDGLAAMGVPVTTFATAGEPLHAAFADYAKKVRLVSWGAEPGRTLAYEFADGKLMFSAVSQLQNFNRDNLRHYLADGVFAKACAQAELIAITDWTLYPHMTDCWHFLLDEVFTRLPGKHQFFFDLVDPSSRSESDILAMLQALKRFTEVGEVTLGLNQNEANILCRINNLDVSPAKVPRSAITQARALLQCLGLKEVVIHSIKYAVAVDADEASHVFGPYCENPLKSTGAGDRFNAGYALGQILNLAMRARLKLACASSGFFVRHARSPSLEELVEFMETLAVAE